LEEPWIYEELYTPGSSGMDPDIEVFVGATDENVHIPVRERERFFRRLTQDEIEVRRYGRPHELSGRVMKGYDPERHRIEPFDVPFHWPVYRCIDPHPRKPHAVTYWAVGPKDTHYICNEIFTTGSAETLAMYIHSIDAQYNVVDSLIDTSSQEAGNWVRDSFRKQLDDQGIRTRLAQKKNLYRSAIISLNSLFEQNRLFVFQTCVRTHRELTLHVYKKSSDFGKTSEEPEDRMNDMIANMRYIVVERPIHENRASIQISESPYQRGF
jgi:hypothetical protein